MDFEGRLWSGTTIIGFSGSFDGSRVFARHDPVREGYDHDRQAFWAFSGFRDGLHDKGSHDRILWVLFSWILGLSGRSIGLGRNFW